MTCPLFGSLKSGLQTSAFIAHTIYVSSYPYFKVQDPNASGTVPL